MVKNMPAIVKAITPVNFVADHGKLILGTYDSHVGLESLVAFINGLKQAA